MAHFDESQGGRYGNEDAPTRMADLFADLVFLRRWEDAAAMLSAGDELRRERLSGAEAIHLAKHLYLRGLVIERRGDFWRVASDAQKAVA